MKKMIEHKLKVLREFQANNTTSHVGGSIGLMIRGIDLKRDLVTSDLDITVDEYECVNITTDGLEDRSDDNDFDFSLKQTMPDGLYVKIDLRVNPEPSFEVIEYNGFNYNVSKLRDILFWKKKYATKGVSKHINDLYTIENGERPLEPVHDNVPFCDDELPF